MRPLTDGHLCPAAYGPLRPLTAAAHPVRPLRSPAVRRSSVPHERTPLCHPPAAPRASYSPPP